METLNAIHRRTFSTSYGNGELITEQPVNGGFTEAVYRKSAQVDCSIMCEHVVRGWPGSGPVLLAIETHRSLEKAMSSVLLAQKATTEDLAPYVSIRAVESKGVHTDGTFHALVTLDYLQGALYSDRD